MSPSQIRVSLYTGLKDQASDGVLPHEMGVFVWHSGQLERARNAVEAVALPFKVLDEHVETISDFAAISTMHVAKGLEFRAVAVMA